VMVQNPRGQDASQPVATHIVPIGSTGNEKPPRR